MANTCKVYMSVLLIVILFVSIIIILDEELNRPRTLSERLDEYESLRCCIKETERYQQLGGILELNGKEIGANIIIMDHKMKMQQNNDNKIDLRQNFVDIEPKITMSKLFRLLKAMPKGAVLHAHDMALCSIDYLIELTYSEHLWICLGPQDQYESLHFSLENPKDEVPTKNCVWVLLADLRDNNRTAEIDSKLRQRFTLSIDPPNASPDTIWKRYRKITAFVQGLITYKPIWHKYFYHALSELHSDGVQYLEVRSSLPKLYNLYATNRTFLNTAKVLNHISTEFVLRNPDFVGVKLIYAPQREQLRYCALAGHLDRALRLKENFPNVFAGLDLPGDEDKSYALDDFSRELIEVQDRIDFYLQAGATNAYGTSADNNIIDAILLGAKRITHAFAILKHPSALKLIKQKKIAIEISPISNQMFGYLTDLRNHPAAYLLSNDFPLVIGSDSPCFWNASPLTHDFFITFLSIASRSANLTMLKQLALNSINYSSLNEFDKANAMRLWMSKWDDWIELVYSTY